MTNLNSAASDTSASGIGITRRCTAGGSTCSCSRRTALSRDRFPLARDTDERPPATANPSLRRSPPPRCTRRSPLAKKSRESEADSAAEIAALPATSKEAARASGRRTSHSGTAGARAARRPYRRMWLRPRSPHRWSRQRLVRCLPRRVLPPVIRCPKPTCRRSIWSTVPGRR